MTAEVYALRVRVQTLESSGTAPDPAVLPEERAAFVARTMAPLTFEADSPDPPFEPA